MKRNINIIAKNYITKIQDFDPVSIENINTLVDCSVDNIIFGCIELVDKNIGKNIFDSLCQKLRPKGIIVLKFHDLKKICQSYINNSISNSDFLHITKNLENAISLDELVTYININNCKIVNITKENNYISIHIMRVVI
jgi:hypothetical protein